jgi:hypothetical protein
MKTNQNQKRILLGGLSAFLLLVLCLVPFLLWQRYQASQEAYDSVESEEVLMDDVSAWYAGGSDSFIRVPYPESKYPYAKRDMTTLALEDNRSLYGNKEVIRIIEVIPHPACSMFPYFVEWGDDQAYNEHLPIGSAGLVALSAVGQQNGQTSSEIAYGFYFFHPTEGYYSQALRTYSMIGDPKAPYYNYKVPMGAEGDAGGNSVSASSGGAYYRTTAAAKTAAQNTPLSGYFELVGWTDKRVSGGAANEDGAAGLYYVNITHVKDLAANLATGNVASRGTAATTAGINYKRQAVRWTPTLSKDGAVTGAANTGEFYIADQLYYYPAIEGRTPSYAGDNAYTANNYNLSFQGTATGSPQPSQPYVIHEASYDPKNYDPNGGHEYDVNDSVIISEGSSAGFAYVSVPSKDYYTIDRESDIYQVTEIYKEGDIGYDETIEARITAGDTKIVGATGLYVRLAGAADGYDVAFAGTYLAEATNVELQRALKGHLELFDSTNQEHLDQFACQLFTVKFNVVEHLHDGTSCIDIDGNPGVPEEDCILFDKGYYRPLPKESIEANDYSYEYVGPGNGRFNLIFEPLNTPGTSLYINETLTEPELSAATNRKTTYFVKEVLSVSRGQGKYHLAATDPSTSDTLKEPQYARPASASATTGPNGEGLDYADYVTNIDWNGGPVTSGTAADTAANGGVRLGGTTGATTVDEYGAWVFVPAGSSGMSETMLKEVIPARGNTNSITGLPGTNSNDMLGTDSYYLPLGTRIYVTGQEIAQERHYTRRDFYNNEWLKLRMMMDNPLNIYMHDDCNVEYITSKDMNKAHCATPMNQLVLNDGTYSLDGNPIRYNGYTPEYIGYDASMPGSFNVWGTVPASGLYSSIAGKNRDPRDAEYTRYLLSEFDRQFQIEIVQVTPDQLTPEMVYHTETKFIYISISPGVNSLNQHWVAINNSRQRYGLPRLAGWGDANGNTNGTGSDSYWEDRKADLPKLRTDTMFALYDAGVINPGAETGIGLLLDVALGGNGPSFINDASSVNNMMKLMFIMTTWSDNCNDPAHIASNGITCPRHQSSGALHMAGRRAYSIANHNAHPFVSAEVVSAHTAGSELPVAGGGSITSLAGKGPVGLSDGPHRFQTYMYDMYPDIYDNYPSYYNTTPRVTGALTRILGTDGYTDKGQRATVANAGGNLSANVSANRAPVALPTTLVNYNEQIYNLVWADAGAAPTVNNQAQWLQEYFMPSQDTSGPDVVPFNSFMNARNAYVPGSAYMYGGKWMVNRLFGSISNHSIWEIFRIRRVSNPSRTPTIYIVPQESESEYLKKVTTASGDTIWVVYADEGIAGSFAIPYQIQGTNITEDITVSYRGEGTPGNPQGNYTMPATGTFTTRTLSDGDVRGGWNSAGKPTRYTITFNASTDGVAAEPVEVLIIVKSIFSLS